MRSLVADKILNKWKKLLIMKYIGISLVYVAFFTLLGFTVYYTKSCYPLWGLFLINLLPDFK